MVTEIPDITPQDVARASILGRDERTICGFKPVKYEITEGVMILTDKRVIFVAKVGSVFKSAVQSLFSIDLDSLKEIK